MTLSRAALAALVPCALLASSASCSLGQGTGEVTSDALFVHQCWGEQHADGTVKGDVYNLNPDFFAAIPFRDTLIIRVQRGNDLQEVSDGIIVLIDDVKKIRAAIAGGGLFDAGVGDAGPADASPLDGGGDPSPGQPDGGSDSPDGGSGSPDGGPGSSPPMCSAAGADGGTGASPPSDPGTFQVAIPAGVNPPGSPTVPPADLLANPPIVHMTLFLHRSCHNQNIDLQAVSGTITFRSLFSGNPNESQASEKLTEASFDVQVGDLSDVPLGHFARDIPCALQSRVKGNFRFFFERGQPGQPFP